VATDAEADAAHAIVRTEEHDSTGGGGGTDAMAGQGGGASDGDAFINGGEGRKGFSWFGGSGIAIRLAADASPAATLVSLEDAFGDAGAKRSGAIWHRQTPDPMRKRHAGRRLRHRQLRRSRWRRRTGRRGRRRHRGLFRTGGEPNAGHRKAQPARRGGGLEPAAQAGYLASV
jgi:hypothetical protein